MSRSGQRRAIRTAGLSGKAATVLCEKSDQGVHALEVWAVEEVAAVSSADDESGLNEALQVKRQRGRGKIQTFGQLGGRISLRTTFDQEAVHAEARFRRERIQGADSFHRFHFSNYMEVLQDCNARGVPRLQNHRWHLSDAVWAPRPRSLSDRIALRQVLKGEPCS